MTDLYPSETLGTIASVQGGFAFKSKDFKQSGVPVLKIKNIRMRDVDTSEVEHVDEQIARDVARYFCNSGDVLISMTGSGPQAPNSVVGRVARFNGPSDTFLINQRVGRFTVKAPDKLDLHFLFYVLSQQEYQSILVSGATGSANQANISGTQIEGLTIPLPTLSAQQAIVSVLSTLDDKIELNRQMNRTLEAMIRAIFEDWFVDYGPTRAKAAGRSRYLGPEVWEVFPDTLDDEEKPNGWSFVPLDGIAEFLNGLALQKFPPEGDASLPVIKIAELRQGINASSDRASANLPDPYIVDDGDVLFSWSGSLTHLVWTGGKGALNQHLFKVTSRKYPKWFFFHWITQHMPRFRATAASKATTMGHIQRHHLSEALTVVPPDSVLSLADKLIAPLFEKCLLNSLEARALAQTRDMLLPKLISGRIRLRDAEKLVEGLS